MKACGTENVNPKELEFWCFDADSSLTASGFKRPSIRAAKARAAARRAGARRARREGKAACNEVA